MEWNKIGKDWKIENKNGYFEKAIFFNLKKNHNSITSNDLPMKRVIYTR